MNITQEDTMLVRWIETATVEEWISSIIEESN